MANIQIIPTGNGPSELGHIGSVVDVIASHFPDSLAKRKFNATDYAYGFELASPKDKASLGEAILVNGICYATSTDPQSADYNHTIAGDKFISSGIFLIPHQAKPSHQVNFVAHEQPISLLDFYGEIYKTINQPCAFVGLVEFAEFHATAVGKAPIDDLNIFEHLDKFYTIPPVASKNEFAFIMGAFTDYRNKKYEKLNKELEVVLYRNPLDTAESELTHHAHVLTLKKSVNKIEAINPALADQTLHLFANKTTISSIQAFVFTIDKLKDLQDQ